MARTFLVATGLATALTGAALTVSAYTSSDVPPPQSYDRCEGVENIIQCHNEVRKANDTYYGGIFFYGLLGLLPGLAMAGAAAGSSDEQLDDFLEGMKHMRTDYWRY